MAESTDDIRAAVRHAAGVGLGVGVLATGHGTGRLIDGVLVNTSRLRSVTVDPANRLARVGAGALWADVIAAAAPHGLTGLMGSSPHVGVVGYTLGGGFGWLGRRYGLAAHAVTRAEVVLADGDLVTARPDRAPRPVLGSAGQRRQPGDRHRARVRAGPGGPGVRRQPLLPADPQPGRAGVLRRLVAGPCPTR